LILHEILIMRRCPLVDLSKPDVGRMPGLDVSQDECLVLSSYNTAFEVMLGVGGLNLLLSNDIASHRFATSFMPNNAPHLPRTRPPIGLISDVVASIEGKVPRRFRVDMHVLQSTLIRVTVESKRATLATTSILFAPQHFALTVPISTVDILKPHNSQNHRHPTQVVVMKLHLVL
jgi:hypothetical protein